jgi:hypothetical protein
MALLLFHGNIGYVKASKSCIINTLFAQTLFCTVEFSMQGYNDKLLNV